MRLLLNLRGSVTSSCINASNVGKPSMECARHDIVRISVGTKGFGYGIGFRVAECGDITSQILLFYRELEAAGKQFGVIDQIIMILQQIWKSGQ